MNRCFVCVAVLLALGVQSAEAQRRPFRHPPPRAASTAPVEFGVRGGYDFDESVGSAGTHLRIPLADPIQIVPSADVYFDDARTQWQLNADLVVRPRMLGGLYAGVGAAFASRDFDTPGERATRAGLNLMAGLRGARVTGTSVRPFVEARWTEVDDYSPFRLHAGIDVPVSGR